MAKILLNPENGAPIEDVFKQVIYTHKTDKAYRYSDEVAAFLLNKFEFLVPLEVASDAVDNYTEAPQREWDDYKDFARNKVAKKEKLMQAKEPDMDRDPNAYYGAGLQEDN